ncbi:MAG: type IV pilus modification protein PilV, partial [Undibacterium sp.]|nr:type IV pilus modification protein PilV [Undibacterium sp.]
MKHFISSRRQSGSSLIEVMISIFVMAVGLLGLASLQVNSMKFEKSSSQRAEASQAAYDLSERMR